jgi:hypothetical protein
MKLRVPRYHHDEKGKLGSIEQLVLEAEKASEKKMLVATATLKWLLEVAKRAPRSAGGRPRKMSKTLLDDEIKMTGQKIAAIKAKHKAIGKAPDGEQTSKSITEVIKSTSDKTGYSEGNIAYLLDHLKPRRKKASRSKTPANLPCKT